MFKPNIKIGHYDLYSWFNSFGIYFQEHAMYEHYAFDYESVVPRTITWQPFNRRQSSMALPH